MSMHPNHNMQHNPSEKPTESPRATANFTSIPRADISVMVASLWPAAAVENAKAIYLCMKKIWLEYEA